MQWWNNKTGTEELTALSHHNSAAWNCGTRVADFDRTRVSPSGIPKFQICDFFDNRGATFHRHRVSGVIPVPRRTSSTTTHWLLEHYCVSVSHIHFAGRQMEYGNTTCGIPLAGIFNNFNLQCYRTFVGP